MVIARTEWLAIEQNGYGLNRMGIDRISWLLIKLTYHDKSWDIMTYHDTSTYYIFVIQIKKSFFCKKEQLRHFVTKIYNYALIFSFLGSAGFLDSASNYAALHSDYIPTTLWLHSESHVLLHFVKSACPWSVNPIRTLFSANDPA